MFAHADFTSAISNATAQLREAEAALNKLACPNIVELTIRLRDLSQDKIEEILEEVPTGYAKKDKEADFVYVIQVPDGDAETISQLRILLEGARRAANDYSRLNPGHEGTKTIYVGRSKTLRARLRQHLGGESQGVFSLHLSRWGTSVDLTLAIYFMRFTNADDLLVQAVEDGIWASLRPAFGRKGEK